LELLTVESFEPHLNPTFALMLGEQAIDLTLTQITRPPVRPYPGIMRDPFSLYFLSASQEVLPQGSYAFVHGGLGELEICIVPVGREPQGIVYEAVFN
jgi:hypothetical protein